MSNSLRDRIFLLRELTLRDLKSRYIGSAGGLLWTVAHPLFTLLLYTLVFSQIIRPGWPQVQTVGSFACYLFAGLLPWIQFQEAITRCAMVFIENGNLIKKVKFPAELLPCSVVLSSISTEVIALCVFLSVLALGYSGGRPALLWLAPALILQLLATFGAGLLVAGCNVFVRDIHQFLSVGFPFLFWATPIIYPPSEIPVSLRWLSNANPLTHLVALYRAALLGGEAPGAGPLLYMTIAALAVCAAGWALLCRSRGILSDYI